MHKNKRTAFVFALVLPATLLVSLVSCGNPAHAPLRVAFDELAAAIIAADSGRVAELAPHLAAPGGSEALAGLATVLAAKPRISIRLLDSRTALIHLESTPPLDLPFERAPNGDWVLAKELRRSQHFDFVPAK